MSREGKERQGETSEREKERTGKEREGETVREGKGREKMARGVK